MITQFLLCPEYGLAYNIRTLIITHRYLQTYRSPVGVQMVCKDCEFMLPKYKSSSKPYKYSQKALNKKVLKMSKKQTTRSFETIVT